MCPDEPREHFHSASCSACGKEGQARPNHQSSKVSPNSATFGPQTKIKTAMTVKGFVQAWDSGMSDFRCSDPAPCRELSAVSKAEERVCSNSLLMGLHVDGFYFCLSLSPIACASISCSTCCQALIHQANTVLARAGSRQ